MSPPAWKSNNTTIISFFIIYHESFLFVMCRTISLYSSTAANAAAYTTSLWSMISVVLIVTMVTYLMYSVTRQNNSLFCSGKWQMLQVATCSVFSRDIKLLVVSVATWTRPNKGNNEKWKWPVARMCFRKSFNEKLINQLCLALAV